MTDKQKKLEESVAVAMRAALRHRINQKIKNDPNLKSKIDAHREKIRAEKRGAITTAGRVGPAVAASAVGAALGGPAGALAGMFGGYQLGKKVFGEEASVNNVGGGAIPGVGVYPGDKSANFGEPGIFRKVQKKHRGKVLRRSPPQSIPTGTFWGETTLRVPDRLIHETRLQKKKGKWWTSYIGEDDVGLAIREWANAHPDSPVILEGENTGYIVFARYGKQ